MDRRREELSQQQAAFDDAHKQRQAQLDQRAAEVEHHQRRGVGDRAAEQHDVAAVDLADDPHVALAVREGLDLQLAGLVPRRAQSPLHAAVLGEGEHEGGGGRGAVHQGPGA